MAASFDCSKASSGNDKIICNDPELSAMDDKLGKTFKQARKKAADRRAFNAASDKQWLWREKNCNNRECLVDWYRHRQTELEAAAAAQAQAANADSKAAVKAAAAASSPAAVASASAPATAAASSAPAPKPATPKTAKPVTEASAETAPKPTAKTARVAANAATAAPAASVASVATATTPASKTMASAPAQTAKPQTLRLQLTATQIAGIAPEGASIRAHYVRANKGEYIYADPDATDNVPVSVHFLGIEHGQYIIEARRKDVYTRYTCSADCALIGKLQLPGDTETDMVILKNDHRSLASQIMTDTLNGLLLESVVAR